MIDWQEINAVASDKLTLVLYRRQTNATPIQIKIKNAYKMITFLDLLFILNVDVCFGLIIILSNVINITRSFRLD